MADFFEELGKKISDVASDIGKKTEDTIEIQKLKRNNRGHQRANARDYNDIGRKEYQILTMWLCVKRLNSVTERREDWMKRSSELREFCNGCRFCRYVCDSSLY